MSDPIYIDIDDISTSQRGGIQIIDVKKGAGIWKRGGAGGFTRTGRVNESDIQRQAEAKRQAEQEAIRQAEIKAEAQRQAQIQLQQQQQKDFQQKQVLATKIKQKVKDTLTLRSQRQTFTNTKQVVSRKIEEQTKKPFKVTVSPSFTPIKFGEPAENIAYRKLTGKNLPGTVVARSDVAERNLMKGNTGEKALGLLFPETQGKLLLDVGTATAITKAPSIVRSGVSIYSGVVGAKILDDPASLPEEKVVGGVLFAGGVAGMTIESLPFAKGKIATLTGAKTLSSQATPEGVIPGKLFGPTRQAVTNVKTQSGKGLDIGVIPEGKGFGFSQAEQTQLIGTKGTITTSARGLVDKSSPKVLVEPGPEGMGLFFTPTPAGTGGGARLSRLGLAQDVFKVPSKNAQLGFSQEKPQIVFQENAKIRNIGYKGSSELETTIGAGAELITKGRGSALLQGQKVSIIEIIGEAGKGQKGTGPKIKQPSTSQTVKINPTSSIVATLKTGFVTTGIGGETVKVPTKRIATTYPTGIINRPTITVVIDRSTPTIRTGGGGSRSIPPPSVIGSPPIPPPPSPDPRPPKPPRVDPVITRPRDPKTLTTPTLAKKKKKKRFFGDEESQKKGSKDFTVELRRQGTFSTIGKTRSIGQAINLGVSKAGGTLGATFRVRGAGRIATPKGFRLPKARGEAPNTFIEKRKYRLSKATEIKEIQKAKRGRR